MASSTYLHDRFAKVTYFAFFPSGNTIKRTVAVKVGCLNFGKKSDVTVQSEQSKLLLNFYRKLPLWSNIFKCHNFKNYKFLSAFIYKRLSLLLLNVKNTLFELAELYVTFLIMAITLNWQDDIIQSSSTFISLQQIAPIPFVCFLQLFRSALYIQQYIHYVLEIISGKNFNAIHWSENTVFEQFFGTGQLFYGVGPTHMALLTIHRRVKFDKVK